MTNKQKNRLSSMRERCRDAERDRQRENNGLEMWGQVRRRSRGGTRMISRRNAADTCCVAQGCIHTLSSESKAAELKTAWLRR